MFQLEVGILTSLACCCPTLGNTFYLLFYSTYDLHVLQLVSILNYSNCSSQVNALLSSLEIDGDTRARGPVPGRFRELEEYWNESQAMKPVPHPADGWVSEFTQYPIGRGDPSSWVRSFEQEHGANGWASEFEHVSK